MANNYYNTPAEVIDANIESGVVKANLPTMKMVFLGMMAGAFIALGGSASNVAVHNIAQVGLARTLAGAIFPVGLMMIVFVGGELFTGNCLLSMGVCQKRVTWVQYLRNLTVVYFSNLAGALIIDFLVFYSGQLDYTSGALGAYTIKVALAKVSITPVRGITSGILCNMLVCVAILMAAAARDIAGKVRAIFFPIWAFVIGGFEHCIANMFYIPMGILAATNPAYVAKAEELYGITGEQCASITAVNSLKNFIPVTIGNIIGGAVFVGIIYLVIHKVDYSKKK